MKRFLQSKWLAKLGAATAVALVAAAARDAHACAMCGLPAGDVATHAYNTSVLFMMAVPYSIVAIGAVVGFFAYRNGRRRAAEGTSPDPQPLSNR